MATPACFTEYLSTIPKEELAFIESTIDAIAKNLPTGFEAQMQYKMPAWVVPFEVYPSGYHCGKNEPLPFVSFAYRKGIFTFYHMGLYAEPALMEWWLNTCKDNGLSKLDMGKSCIRFKKPNQIPVTLLGKLCAQRTPEQWISLYETKFKPKKSK